VCRVVRRFPKLGYILVNGHVYSSELPSRYSFCGSGGTVCLQAALGPWQEIQQAAYAYQLAQESGDSILVGVNRFQADEEAPVDLLKIDASVETRQLEKLAALKARRDNDAVRAALALVTETARGDGNLMPVIIDAVKTYATLGEVSDAMREVFGEFDAPVFI